MARMGRPPKGPSGSRRYNVTLDSVDADRLEAHAASVEGRPTTVAGELIRAQLAIAEGSAGEELEALRRRNEELERQLAAVQYDGLPIDAAAGARWEWAVEDLLEDRAWWD